MAFYKIVGTRVQGDERIVKGYAYSPVPVTDNAAGIPWRTVVGEYQAAETSRFRSMVTPPDGVTRADLDTGLMYEWWFRVTIPTGVARAEAVTLIEDGIRAKEADATKNLADRFRFWGLQGSTD